MDIKDYLSRRKKELEKERASFIPHWMELSEYIRPRRGRFSVQDRNKGDKRYQAIINSRATKAWQIAKSGMLAGSMSPARPWFALETHNPDLMESTAVKDYLYRVELIMRSVFNESNFYSQAPEFLGELILFGTASMVHVDDFQDVARFYTQTAGSYMISQDDRGVVDTLFREFEWSAYQIVKAFGVDNVSTQVRQAVNTNRIDAWYPVCHIIEPNDNFRPGSPLASEKRFRSIYYEPGTDKGQDKNKWLAFEGFDEFPAYVARWDVTANDIYGTDCPAMTALGDIKGLQIEEKRKAQAIDKMVNPPLHGPPSLRNVPISTLPGGMTIYDDQGTSNGLRPVYEIKAQLQDLRADMDAVERRIEEAFFVDLFLAISNMEGIQPRNQLDLMQRNEERLLQLGPVLEHIQGEFLGPLIDRTFNQCARAGILPDAPPELEGENLKIKYVSTLAMAQRAVATQGIDRVVGFVGNMAQVFPDMIDKVNQDQVVDEYAHAVGVPPSLIVPDDVVAQKRAKRQQEQQLMQGLAAADAAAGIGQKLGSEEQ